MQYRQLGRSDLKVSLIGLGTMTFGEQNTEAEAHAQIDYALGRGVNFIDAAEMYPVPPRAETQGRTEQYIGSWLKQSGRRQDVILATKAAGPADVRGVNHVRGGRTRLNLACLEEALNDSLRRLQTDYVDLYQLHWPDRSTNRFGQLGYRHVDDEQPVPIEETAAALTALVRSGKVRHVGVSNETPWGLAQYLKAADSGLTRIVSIQNPYSLLNRSFEVGLAEFAVRDQMSLIAYSPLAFGTLSGKFLDGARPPSARVTRWARFSRYSGEAAQRATAEYVAVARRHGLDPAQMAIAFVMSQRFVASTLIGATTMEQLKINLASEGLRLPAEVLDELEQVQRRNPNPCS
jgi:aryl-alcohol dehydrogenase-like predicted oxidoreductase